MLIIFVCVRVFADVNWGSSTQAQTYKSALTSVHKLINVHEHVKNYEPQILVLSGKPQDRPPLVDLSHLITKNSALMVCGHVSEVRTRLNLYSYSSPSNSLY
jgi:solute carrier family 12 sodium/potassium/chloride transporter 2